MTRSLRSRMMLSAAAVAVLFVLALIPALQSAFNQTLEQVIRQRLAADANTLIGAASVHEGSLRMPELLPNEEFNLPEASLLGYIHDADGRLLWASGSTLDEQITYRPAYQGGRTDFVRIQDGRGRLFYVYDVELELSGNGVLPLSFITMLPASEFAELQHSYRWRLHTWLVGGLALLLLLLWVGLTWSFRLLKDLRGELDEIESGCRDRLSETYPREMLRLTRSLNRLLESERRQRSRYRDSLADLAHSLKTPLAVLQTVAEKLRSQPDGSVHAGVLQQQIERMSQQIGYQLQRASLRRSGLVQHRERLAPLVQQLCDALDKVYPDKRIELERNFTDECWVPVERGALLELLGNLLENAYRLCLGKIRISARLHQNRCELIVEDDGPGVPADQRQRIIQRGERLDTQHQGQGIGLSVVSDIVDSYDGQLTLTESDLGGAAFRLLLRVEGAAQEYEDAPWFRRNARRRPQR